MQLYERLRPALVKRTPPAAAAVDLVSCWGEGEALAAAPGRTPSLRRRRFPLPAVRPGGQAAASKPSRVETSSVSAEAGGTQSTFPLQKEEEAVVARAAAAAEEEEAAAEKTMGACSPSRWMMSPAAATARRGAAAAVAVVPVEGRRAPERAVAVEGVATFAPHCSSRAEPAFGAVVGVRRFQALTPLVVLNCESTSVASQAAGSDRVVRP